MNVAIVGCGYVAESYCVTMGNYPGLTIAGVYDRNRDHQRATCERWSLRAYRSLDEVLADQSVTIVLNLTNPSSHYEINRRCLEAGKHVYSEKPLAMTLDKAEELAGLARAKGLYLASAPCSLLSETAQTLWQAIRDGAIGRVRLVYANFDDGMIAPNASPWQWRNGVGVAWPAKDEFEVGCTYEHAGYLLTWLAAFFGPVRKVTSFAACLIPDKGIAVDHMAPDFTVGCLEHDDVVVRLTCSLVAPRDKSLMVVGDRGVLLVAHVRHDTAPVYIRSIPSQGWAARIERRVNGLRRSLHLPGWERDWHRWRRYPPVRSGSGRGKTAGSAKQVDFCSGVHELAEAIEQARPCRLSADLGCHVVDLIERLQYPERYAGRPDVTTRFRAIEPLPHGSPSRG